MRIKKLYLDDLYVYTLHDTVGKEFGIIKLKTFSSRVGNYGQIDTFCVQEKYRHSKHKYGKNLFNTVIHDANQQKGITVFSVYPKGEEYYDKNKEPMDLEILYQIYKKLGFAFKDANLKPYGNEMILNFIPQNSDKTLS